MDYWQKTYFARHTKDLGQALDAELGGALEKLIFNALQANEEDYDAEYHNEDKIQADVEKLYKMGQGKLGTDEAGLFKILCASPPEYLRKVNLAYAEKYGYTLSKALEKELSGKVESAAVFLLGMKLKPMETVAELIDKACKGMGTNELLLTSILVRYQPVLAQVDAAHIMACWQSIADRVKHEAGGDYRRVLLELLGAD